MDVEDIPVRGGNGAMAQIEEKVREVLAENGRIPVQGLGEHDDLYARGLTSHASVDLMLALEDAFDIEFPESLLKKQTFSSVSSIVEALSTIV